MAANWRRRLMSTTNAAPAPCSGAARRPLPWQRQLNQASPTEPGTRSTLARGDPELRRDHRQPMPRPARIEGGRPHQQADTGYIAYTIRQTITCA
jgi:hypothetical protein